MSGWDRGWEYFGEGEWLEDRSNTEVWGGQTPIWQIIMVFSFLTDGALLAAGRWVLGEAGLADLEGELHTRGAHWLGPATDHLIFWRLFEHFFKPHSW